MKISVNELKKFKQKSDFIRNGGIVPICDFLKFDNGRVTKTNTHSWFVGDISFKGKMLVPEKALFDLLAITGEKQIEITEKDGRVTITDGKKKTVVNGDEFKNFLSFPEPEGKYVPLSDNMVEAIGIASNYPAPMELTRPMNSVHISSKAVTAANTQCGYCQPVVEETVESIAIPKDVAKVIGPLQDVSMATNERWLFFRSGEDVRVFIKSEDVFFDMGKIFEYNDKAECVVVDKREIIAFSDWCLSSCRGKFATVEMSMNDDGKLMLNLNDADFEITNNELIEVTGSFDGVFTFNPQYMSQLLKHYPDDVISIFITEKYLHIIGESGAIGRLQALAPQV